jgi:hypothetical protein
MDGASACHFCIRAIGCHEVASDAHLGRDVRNHVPHPVEEHDLETWLTETGQLADVVRV